MSEFVGRLLMRAWYLSRQASAAYLPYPEDAPVARVPGPDLLRVLLVGNGAASGAGVASHELALTGHLARTLAERTGRGVQVDARVDRALRLAGLPSLLGDLREGRYDAAVLLAGMSDAVSLTALPDWRAAMSRVLERLVAAVPARSVLVIGPQPVRSVSVFQGWPCAFAERHRKAMHRVTALLCAERGTAFRVLPAPGLPPGEPGYRSPVVYGEWAAWIAEQVVPLLPAVVRSSADEQEEAERQRAVEALQPDAPADPRLDRIAQLARDMFGTGVAAVSLIDGAEQKNRSVVGSDLRTLPRAVSLCDHTIRNDGPLVVPDLSQDPRFRDNPAVRRGTRFYAGYPIESPDGYRVGALCVLDDRPRDASEIDTGALAELALLAQKELWAAAAD